jgi:ethanolamine ammonia-lyase small subunit
MNEIGELLAPAAVVLLIGERPGLASVESLSAYLAYRPRNGHTDANRNLVSNIRQSGAPLVGGAARILNMIQAMLKGCTSGVHLKEESFRPILK